MLWPIIFQYHVGSYYVVGPMFWEGGGIIPIVCLSYIFYGLFVLQMPSIYLKMKQTWAPVFWGTGFAINIMANCALIPRFGIYGAAYATLLAYCSMSMMLIYKNQSWLPIKYQINKLVLFCVFSVIAYCCAQYASTQYIYYIVVAYGAGSIYYIYKIFRRLIPFLD